MNAYRLIVNEDTPDQTIEEFEDAPAALARLDALTAAGAPVVAEWLEPDLACEDGPNFRQVCWPSGYASWSWLPTLELREHARA